MSAALKTSAEAKAMRTTKYPPEFQRKVDMGKVNLPVIKKWVSDEVARLLGNDDDVVIEMIFNIIEGSKSPNIKQLQYDLTGFLDKDAPSFCLNLWKLCLDAQDSPNGIPKSLLEAKKLELIQEKLAEDRARELAEQRQNEEREREREMTRMRERERGPRRRGGRGGRRGRDRDSRSPPPRRRDGRGERGGPPRVDSYVPGGRGRGRDEPSRRRRSPSYGGRSPSRSRSPPRRRRRRNSSSDISDKADNKGRRTRSPSPRRHRRSPSQSNDDRSPPPRRRRRSPSRSRSPPRKRQSRIGSGDLMSNTDCKKDRLEAPRLSREGSEVSEHANGGAKPDESRQPFTRHTPLQRTASRGTKPPIPLKISREELEARLSVAKAEAARNAKRKDSAATVTEHPA